MIINLFRTVNNDNSFIEIYEWISTRNLIKLLINRWNGQILPMNKLDAHFEQIAPINFSSRTIFFFFL